MDDFFAGNDKGKCPRDMLSDGVLAYGVQVGRFEFEDEGYTVYILSDLMHIGSSDVDMIFQITKSDYMMLLSKSCSNRIPNVPVSRIVIEDCKKDFLCGESAYCKRYYCTLNDVNLSYI